MTTRQALGLMAVLAIAAGCGSSRTGPSKEELAAAIRQGIDERRPTACLGIAGEGGFPVKIRAGSVELAQYEALVTAGLLTAEAKQWQGLTPTAVPWDRARPEAPVIHGTEFSLTQTGEGLLVGIAGALSERQCFRYGETSVEVLHFTEPHDAAGKMSTQATFKYSGVVAAGGWADGLEPGSPLRAAIEGQAEPREATLWLAWTTDGWKVDWGKSSGLAF